jgi:hypothetical protein
MKYKTLFSISMDHEYYINQKCRDVVLVPGSDCLQLIKKHRGRLKQFPASIEIVVPVDEEGTPFIPLEGGVCFRFYIQLKYPQFFHFTKDFEEIDKVHPNKQSITLEQAAFKKWCFPYYTNISDNNAKLPLGVYKCNASEAFQVQAGPKQHEEVFFLKGIPVPGLEKEDFVLNGPDCIKNNIIAYDEEMKRLRINTRLCTPGMPFEVTYWCISSWPDYAFGLVDIFTSNPIEMGKSYQIRFHSKKIQWKYYVVANDERLTIDGPLSFSSVAAPNDEIGMMLRSAYPDAKVVLFSSSEELAYKEEARAGIKLKQDSLIKLDHMPNPKPGSQGVEIVKVYREPG